MKEIINLLKAMTQDEGLRDSLQQLTTQGLKYIDKAQKYLDDVKKNGDFESIAQITNEAVKQIHEKLAEKFRTGEFGPETVEQVHRMSIIAPSPLTENFEKFIKFFAEKYQK